MLAEKNLSFQLLKYVRPIWYFHLKPSNGGNIVWVDFEKLSGKALSLIHYDSGYSHPTICSWDASYQALMKGIVKQAENNIKTDEIELLPADIYRFTRKYHKNIWLYVTFFQRLFSLYNPVSEFIALWQTRKVKYTNLFYTYYDYEDYPNFDSPLVKSNSLITIIIPTFNRYNVLASLLADLEKQNYSNFEVLIIDQSLDFNEEFYKKYKYKINIIRQKTPALWRARNKGIETANSDLLLFLDDDSRLRPDWIFEHLKCIDYFKADISSGISKSKIGAKIPENYSYFRLSDQLDTGNVLIKKEVFIKCGLFDEKFEKMRMGDGEFGVRAYLNGFINISNPFAFRDHLKIKNGGLRYWGHWDAYRSKNILAPRPIPSVLYLYRKYWGNDAALFQLLQSIPLSYTPYRLKSRMWGYILSLCIFFLFFPIVILQTISSWRTSSKMLNGNSQIKKL